jgi:hypothetical protein
MTKAPIIIVYQDQDVNIRVGMAVASGLRSKKYHVLDAVWVLLVQCFNEGVHRLTLFACQQVIQRIAHSHPSCLK